MCTVTVIQLDTPQGPGLRLISSRDEQDTRKPAHPPTWHDLKAARAIWPTDADSGGTWVAGATSGLLVSLLNYNLKPPPPTPANPISRGAVIPQALKARSIDELADHLQSMDAARYVPFRLIAAGIAHNTPRVLEFRWNGSQKDLIEHNPPVCFASSGLGDSIAQPRVPLFNETVAPKPTAQTQDAFHRHAWPDRGAASVYMRRPGASTVSITTVTAIPADSGAWAIEMDYRPTPRESEPGQDTQHLSPRARSGAAG